MKRMTSISNNLSLFARRKMRMRGSAKSQARMNPIVSRRRMRTRRTCRSVTTMTTRRHNNLLPRLTELPSILISSLVTLMLPQRAKSIRENSQMASTRTLPTSSCTTSSRNTHLKRRMIRVAQLVTSSWIRNGRRPPPEKSSKSKRKWTTPLLTSIWTSISAERGSTSTWTMQTDWTPLTCQPSWNTFAATRA